MASDVERHDTAAVARDDAAALEAADRRPEDRAAKVQRIMADADARDDQADARDLVADRRDELSSRAAFLLPDADFDAALHARRSAAYDRLDAKIDRTSSAHDRSELADHDRETGTAATRDDSTGDAEK